MIEVITSQQNPKVKLLLQLQQKSSERRRTGLFVVEGRRELMHCLESGFTIDTVFLCPSVETATESMPLLPDGVRAFEVSKEVYEKIAYRGSTEGVIAEVKSRHLTLNDLRLPEQPLVVVLERVEKPGNLGPFFVLPMPQVSTPSSSATRCPTFTILTSSAHP